MLSLLPLYFIGKYYYQLAHEHDRSRWGFAVLGAGIYILAQLLLGIVLGIILVATNSNTDFTTGSQLLLSIVSILMGVGVASFVYYLIKKSWEKNPRSTTNNDLLDR